jgi:hypothetical protein
VVDRYRARRRNSARFLVVVSGAAGKEVADIDARFGLFELSGAVMLPRSLRCATRRIKTMRKRKPGRPATPSGTQKARFGRDDKQEKIGGGDRFAVWSRRVEWGWDVAKVPPLRRPRTQIVRKRRRPAPVGMTAKKNCGERSVESRVSLEGNGIGSGGGWFPR